MPVYPVTVPAFARAYKPSDRVERLGGDPGLAIRARRCRVERMLKVHRATADDLCFRDQQVAR